MFVFILLFLINLSYCDFVIEENKESPSSFKIHTGEPNVVYAMPQADDVTLQSFQQNSFCHVQQQTVQTQTQQFTIIQPHDFKDYEFEKDTPLNFRQFIGMVHVNDGMIAITSDAIAYLLKFNYDNVLQKNGFKTYGNSNDFAGVIWKANLQSVIPSLISRSELPQLVYSRTNNLAFVLFSDSGQFFSVSEMENNDKSLYIYQIANWRFREERGLTKEIDGYLFSAVGKAGMDVYKINNFDVYFERTISFEDLKIQKHLLDLKDFAIIKIKDGQYQLYLLDAKLGLILAYMYINDQGMQFETVITVEPVQGGIAMDTKNGQNVFAAFEQNGYYFYIEYFVDFINKSYSIITQKSSNYRILDVDATDEFAIISGVNHHQIVFQNGYDFIAPHKEKIVFTQIGMRDFEFFKYTYEKQELEEASTDEFQYDDFFFGVTAANAFLTKFKFVPARVKCFVDYNQQLETNKQYYFVQYNQSHVVNNIVSTDKIIRTTKNFTVEVVTTFLYSEQMEFIYVLIIFFIVTLFISTSVVCYHLRNFRQEEQRLDTEIQIQKTKAVDDSNQQIQMNESSVKDIQKEQ